MASKPSTNKTKIPIAPTQESISANSKKHIEKLHYMKAILALRSDVPKEFLAPITHELNKLQTMFNNTLHFLPEDENKDKDKS